MALVVRFGRFELDEDAGELRADGRVLELQAKPWALLVLLCGHPGRLFTRDELLERLWPDVTVEDGSLSRTVSRLRRVLGSEVLQTVPRRGYRLAAAVEAVPAEVTERRGVAEAIDRGLDAFGAVLVAGPPGSGRTAASRAPSRGGARRWLAVDADRGLVGSMAAALGVGVADPNSVSLALAALGPTLIVVDDLDHDPRGVELVDQWRAAAPLARWLVTAGSRLPLDRCAVVWLDPLPEGEAIALLAERSGLPLDRADPAASALARALDGNPLALTLAARLLRLMPPGELVNRLGEQRLALLKDPRTSLAAALASAWDRLPTELRTAAARLACVRAALPIGAAEAAVGDDAAERLLRLVEAGWATRSGSTLAVPNNARAWIEAHGDPNQAAAGREALGEHLAATGTPRAAAVRRAGDPGALEWLVAHADPLVELAATRSDVAELALEALTHRGGPVEPLKDATAGFDDVVGLLVRVRVLRMSGERAAALAAAVRAVAAAERSDPALVGEANTQLALTAALVGEDAEVAVERAVAEARGPDALARALVVRYHARRASGTVDLEPLESAVALPLPPRSAARATALGTLAGALTTQGRLREAAALSAEWLTEQVGAPLTARHVIETNLGGVLARLGRLDEAEQRWRVGRALAARAGDLERWAIYAVHRGRCLLVAGAVGVEEELQQVARTPGLSARATSQLRMGLGLCALRRGEPGQASLRLAEAAAHDPGGSVLAHAFRAVAEVQLGEVDPARACVAAARTQRIPEIASDFAIELAEAWLGWARGDTGVVRDALARFDRAPDPRVEPPWRRLPEIEWLAPPVPDGDTAAR